MKTVFIGRVSDGTILCETYDDPTPSQERFAIPKQKAKKLLANLKNQPNERTVTLDNHVFQ
jgi:hypothetical protein